MKMDLNRLSLTLLKGASYSMRSEKHKTTSAALITKLWTLLLHVLWALANCFSESCHTKDQLPVANLSIILVRQILDNRISALLEHGLKL